VNYACESRCPHERMIREQNTQFVIARNEVTKQSRAKDADIRSGLLRRYAPRNDKRK